MEIFNTQKNKRNFYKFITILVLLQKIYTGYTYDDYGLKFLRTKLEKKLDNNYLLAQIERFQRTEPDTCSTLLGSECMFINEKTIAFRGETDNQEYIKLAYSMHAHLLNTNVQIISSLKDPTYFGEDILFKDDTRKILDQVLFPKRYPRTSLYIFTFETFEVRSTEYKVDKAYTFPVTSKLFIDRSLAYDTNILVNIKDLYIPPKK